MTQPYLVIGDKKRKAGRIRFILLILCVTIVMWLLGASFFDQNAVGSDQEMVQIVVEEGDSLWSICKELQMEGDIRRMIYQIKIINNLEQSTIYPGQVLLVPVH
ncbi:LysM peptidoglycan-binding domain-containing protein [Metallumcola ferriviriculae]|uniref:LysM peptidoglycan-binding domain-containing protein n=1 Tax=Metallumcola ferriviriculae TaxID=3039180 RepID=A0AAU0UPB2_9FIRM|nr:LysM peptidoglycan-binding domain-containing protein [Desulfitibacteraceae bacterium MK1]